MSRNQWRILRWSAGFLALIIVLSTLAIYGLLRGSLPDLDAEIVAASISAPITIERDARGAPTLRATNRRDLAYATGYVHGQDRYFQMDLLRRLAGGELAELLGPALVETDREMRRHGFIALSHAIVAGLSPFERQLLDAYAAGVNDALADLTVRPWEYLALRSQPRAWEPHDSLLVGYAMYVDLNDSDGEEELAAQALRNTLPAEMYAFLHPLGSEWDAPIDGGTWRIPAIPDAAVFDLRNGDPRIAALNLPVRARYDWSGDAAQGSNSWAVSGTLAGGGALLANDMHLGLQIPNIWYRARLVVDASLPEQRRDLVGVTLPGLPLLVVGSNGAVAWGYTNTHGDWTDVVIVDLDPADASRYLTAEGSEPFVRVTEIIKVRGGAAQSYTVERTRWGPVIAHDSQGRPLALRWTAHDIDATNLGMLALETAGNVEEALATASRIGAPVQNFVAADDAGHIGWTLFGRVPVRANYDSRFPARWSAPETGWTRWRTPEEYPRVVDPLGGRIWTANTRTIEAQAWFDFVGPGGYVLGARAAQIRDGLLAVRQPTPQDMLAIQLDDRALFLARWRDLLLGILQRPDRADDARIALAREQVAGWSGRADIADVGYRIVRTFRETVVSAIFDSLTARARLTYPAVDFEPPPQFEAPVWQLLSERPAHLLDPRYETWDIALTTWLDRTLADLERECGDLAACTWGRRNSLAMRHPLSRAVPMLAFALDMPTEPLPGDANMPRVQGTRHGASERLVVSPGREAEGLFHMPGGQSAHPLSPYFKTDHEAWVQGSPTSLLPGPAVHTLRFEPRGS